MEPDLNQQQQIDDYLEGRLSTSDKQAFETLLQRDPQLSEAVRFERFLRKGLQTAEFKAKFAALHQNLHQNADSKVVSLPTPEKLRKAGVFQVNKPPTRSMWWQYAAAACVVGILAGVGYFYIQSQDDGQPQLADQSPVVGKDSSVSQNDPPKSPNEPVTIAANRVPIERQSTEFFNQQEQGQLLSNRTENIDFTLSEEDRQSLFNRYFVADTIANPHSETEVKYNAGIEALRRQTPREAAEAFHWVVTQTNEGILRQKAQWYAGLAYLQAGDLTEALLIISVIKQTEGHYFQKKSALLYQRLR